MTDGMCGTGGNALRAVYMLACPDSLSKGEAKRSKFSVALTFWVKYGVYPV